METFMGVIKIKKNDHSTTRIKFFRMWFKTFWRFHYEYEKSLCGFPRAKRFFLFVSKAIVITTPGYLYVSFIVSEFVHFWVDKLQFFQRFRQNCLYATDLKLTNIIAFIIFFYFFSRRRSATSERTISRSGRRHGRHTSVRKIKESRSCQTVGPRKGRTKKTSYAYLFIVCFFFFFSK